MTEESRIDHLRAALRDLALGGRMMQLPGGSAAFNAYAKEVERVAMIALGRDDEFSLGIAA